MWQIETTEKFDRIYKKYEKKHPNELSALLSNLETLLEFLNNGLPLSQIKVNWLHKEPMGTLAITEKRSGRKYLKATRLYILPIKNEENILALTIGDKNTQETDIQDIKKFVKIYRKNNEEQI